jgi:hypothetical protein
MSKPIFLKSIPFLLAMILFISVFGSPPADSAFIYKSYIVHQDRGKDILCDPYIVKKNDYVLKLFKQKGEIANKDFPEFLSIFKRINPHVHDINTIRPNQHIFIPLKKLRPNTLPGQSSGFVTIPFITISNMQEILLTYAMQYKVQRGDCVSKIIARRYGAYGSKSYREGIHLFKLFNPDVVNLDVIYQNQTLHIPDPSLRNQPWSQSLLNGEGAKLFDADRKDSIPSDGSASEPFVPEDVPDVPLTPFAAVASALDARLLNSGVYYFPREGETDFELDLARFPVIERDNETLVFTSDDNAIQESDLKLIQSFRKKMKIVSISSDPSTEQIMDSILEPDEKASDDGEQISLFDNGVEVKIRANWITRKSSQTENPDRRICITLIDNWGERTPDSIRNFLEQHNIVVKDMLRQNKNSIPKPKQLLPGYAGQDVITIDPLDRSAFVKVFFTAIGCAYAQNVSIMFPYAGIQVKAVSNLISTPDGKELLVDFGDLYGDAVQSIERTGFKIIQVTAKESVARMIVRLLEAVDMPYTPNPTFLAAKRPPTFNTEVTIPGFLVENKKKSKTLLAAGPLHDRIVQFLGEQRIKVITIGSIKPYS